MRPIIQNSLAILGVLALVAAALVFFGVVPNCPPVEAVAGYRPPEATRVYAADGALLAQLAPQRRIRVELSDISPLIRDGLVAVEDRRFFEHGGVDARGVLRAAWHNLTSLSLEQGFSTLTMQLVRNLFPERLPRSEKFRRKICEVRLAGEIEERYGKREILEMYLNQVYFGDGLYGIEAASRGYFGVPAESVSVAQAALLVGLVQSPEGYNPREDPEDARGRRGVVLEIMADQGAITEERADRAAAAPLDVRPPPEGASPAPYFVAAVSAELRRRFGPQAEAAGLHVYTGLVPELQRAAREALVWQIRRIEDGAYGRYRHPVPGTDSANAAAGELAEDVSPYLQGAFVALDAGTGTVRALLGGRDYSRSQYNRALMARRQPGSAFKPIVYATAIEAGMPVTARIPTGPVVVADTDGTPWRPSDHVADSITTLPLHRALAISSNRAAVRVGMSVGLDAVTGMARRLGISTPIPDYPSVFLGAAEVRPIELVAAYAAFANGGRRVQPHLITRVEDGDHNVLWRSIPTGERVIGAGVAYIIVHLLREVVNSGTGTAVRAAGYRGPAAGKTGTTDGARDVWFIGMTPSLATGVWLGLDRPRTILPGASGGRLAAPVWAAFMNEARATGALAAAAMSSAPRTSAPTGRSAVTEPSAGAAASRSATEPSVGTPGARVATDTAAIPTTAASITPRAPTSWTPPAALVELRIDSANGFRATGDCPLDNVQTHYFLPGTEPERTCPLHPESGVERFFEGIWDGLRGLFGGDESDTTGRI